MRKFTKTMAAVLSLTMTLTMVTPVFAEGETNITPAQTTEVVTPTPTPAQPPKNGLFVNEGKTYCYKNGKLVKNPQQRDWLVHALISVGETLRKLSSGAPPRLNTGEA